jgi:hypothetical protein
MQGTTTKGRITLTLTKAGSCGIRDLFPATKEVPDGAIGGSLEMRWCSQPRQ